MIRNIPLFTRSMLLAMSVSLIFQSCEEDDDDVSVTPKTYLVENVTSTSATVRNTVIVTGGKLEEAGLCFSSTTNLPTVSNSRTISSNGSLTDFTVTMTGLSKDSVYRYVAYATLGGKTYYGAVYAFRPVDTDIEKDMVLVEGGQYWMGATQEQEPFANDIEKPMHLVTISNFKVSKYEVTTTQFVVFLNSRKISKGGSGMTRSGKSHAYFFAMSKNIYFDSDSSCWRVVSGYEDCPMTNVTWYGADEFCRWAGGQLPTEAQWEYAARGGKYSGGFVYSGDAVLDIVAWYASTTNNQDGIEYYAQPVGGKKPNELGLYDMCGNVWEWCNDWYALYSSKAQADPIGLADKDAEIATSPEKVRRGGGWADVNAKSLRVSNRSKNTPVSYSGSVGFRIASKE